MPDLSRSHRRIRSWTLIGAAISLIAGFLLGRIGHRPVALDSCIKSAPPGGDAASEIHNAVPQSAQDSPTPVARVEATPAATPARVATSFAERVRRLCVLSGRTAALAQQDEHEAARALDDEARDLLEDTLAVIPDAGERALSMVVDIPDAADGAARAPGENIRLGVLQVILENALARRVGPGERARADSLTQAMLDTMPIGMNLAEMGDRVLHQRPYIQAVHEPTVLDLLSLASQGAFSREIATRLLLTLWDNLKEAGVRSSAELSRLALVTLDDSDPSQLVVACRQLLSDPRFRDLAIAWLREREDPKLAGAVAALAGRELPPNDAVVVLRELAPMLQHTRGIFLSVGARAPEVVADAYRLQLAAGTHPQVRRELVMSVGMLPGEHGRSTARLALDQDPSPEVRLQAMFAHTVQGGPARAEAALHQVLDDPVIASDPSHLGAVVLALENLEHDDANAVARVGARLQAMPLSPRSRSLLDELLARSLPGGGR
ncbi:MAG: hypothetical protein VX044_05735 [Planctomycetota bacterium]|nr:hypothetical protein [Planctomycetota bacterium]